jgi:hypothetical protein
MTRFHSFLILLILCIATSAMAQRQLEVLDSSNYLAPSFGPLDDRSGNPFIEFGAGLEGLDIRVHQGPVSGHDGCKSVAECMAEGLHDPNDCTGAAYGDQWKHAHDPGLPSIPVTHYRESPASLDPGEPFYQSGLAKINKGRHPVTDDPLWGVAGIAYGDGCGIYRDSIVCGVFVPGPVYGAEIDIHGFANPGAQTAPGSGRVRFYDSTGAIVYQWIEGPSYVHSKINTHATSAGDIAAFCVDSIIDYDQVTVFDVREVLAPGCGTCDTDSDGFDNQCDGDFDQDGVVTPGDYTQLFIPDLSTGTDSGWGTDMDCNGVVTPGDFTQFFIPQLIKGTPGL